MKNINIEKIEWMSKEAEEAIIYLNDGNYKIICFSCPFNEEELNKGNYQINCYDTIGFERIKGEAYHIGKLSDFFSYRLYCKVKDRKEGIVKIGEFQFYLEDGVFPGDIADGDFVTFECGRFDLY
ncbi:hypothetical protein [Tenacibaculum maritimum]|uniref:hypothetical protein n=1 Tax=Tenacibaculum maritimum TaxID=107401 RepID=UPI0010A31ACA|nr:hypothetical protein [Tenacibaculum maritimum]MCD9564250.1 hypothetical protein [Tenacibaculum maritimum]MCD9567077.1 hypothetical protein [Tenacibaculum maritimum]MCD9580285.1 hypothetical protein [Tenacibaculum maritimum]MCD9583071.1 hypothetical protein [Tenacibaculum maritimum]MCD9598046.1 hypothetical protein [Tenacibaculum maritimum]